MEKGKKTIANLSIDQIPTSPHLKAKKEMSVSLSYKVKRVQKIQFSLHVLRSDDSIPRLNFYFSWFSCTGPKRKLRADKTLKDWLSGH
jgi:hypothetical protein